MAQWRVEARDLDGSVRVSSLDLGAFSFKQVLNGAKSFDADISMVKVPRAHVAPGITDVRIYDPDGVLRSDAHIWKVAPDTDSDELRANIIGEDYWSIIRDKRTINWQARYEPEVEDPPNLNTQYEVPQEDIAWDQIARSQAETDGDLGLTQGTHVGSSPLRRRWWCKEDGLHVGEPIEDFTKLSNGIDFALTPILTDPTPGTFRTWNPNRGSDLRSSVVIDGTKFLDTLLYDIDAKTIVNRGHAKVQGDCDPYMADFVESGSRSTYGLLEDFADVDTDHSEDADEAAEELVDQNTVPLVADSIEYWLPRGPALGAFDVGDIITIQSLRPGWNLDIPVRVLEIEVTVELPHEWNSTYVRVGWKQVP